MTKRRKRRKPQMKVVKRDAILDIVIPVYGQLEFLEKCLASIQATRGDLGLRVILVDDCSPNADEMTAFYESCRERYPDLGRVHIVRNRVNVGFPKTANRGVMQGSAPFVLVLNSDVELQTGCLQTMLQEFDDPKVGAVGPMLLFPPDCPDPARPVGKVQHVGLCVDIRGRIVHANSGWSADNPKVRERRVVQAVTGACLMTRREAWNRVWEFYKQNGDPSEGAFNEIYSRGTYEDVEFCFALRGMDYQVVVQPKAVATHYVGASATDERGFPLSRNASVFQVRCGHLMAWDEWRFC